MTRVDLPVGPRPEVPGQLNLFDPPPAAPVFPTPFPSTGWDLPAQGGAYINGRRYTEHALERMAPRTPEVIADLERRAIERARAEGFTPGTREFKEWWGDFGPDPRGVPSMVIEAEIARPRSTSVRVITNHAGDVVTVIYR